VIRRRKISDPTLHRRIISYPEVHRRSYYQNPVLIHRRVLNYPQRRTYIQLSPQTRSSVYQKYPAINRRAIEYSVGPGYEPVVQIPELHERYVAVPEVHQRSIDLPNVHTRAMSAPKDDAIVVMKNVPMNPLSDPNKLNLDDIPLVPANQVVYLHQPYLVVKHEKQ
jgi:hypothetical protein